MTNFETALHLGSLGIPVFPTQVEGDKRKQPVPGLLWRQRSSADRHAIEAMWRMHREAAPAIDVAKTDFVIIDCDAEKPGPKGHVHGVGWFREECERREFDLTSVPIVSTPSGGWHVYFKQPAEGERLGNSRGSLPPKKDTGVDVRGSGGYVLAPGAEIDIGRYELLEGLELSEAPEAPGWLVDMLRGKRAEGAGAGPETTVPAQNSAIPTRPAPVAEMSRREAYADEAFRREVQEVATTGDGGRNTRLNQAAFSLGQLVAGGVLAEGDVWSALRGAAEACGLTKDDGAKSVDKTIRSGLRGGKAHPRTGPEDDGAAGDLAHGAMIARRLLARAESGELVDQETGEIVEAGVPDSGVPPFPEELTQLPGLVGDITEWICKTARRPQPALALGAAITIVGTAAGRQFVGPTRSGLHLYVLALADTGFGKDHSMTAVGRILRASELASCIGPSQFMSLPSILKLLTRKPLSLCVVDEFGSYFRRINNKKASGFEAAMTGIIRTAWGTSFDIMMTPEWAGKAAEEICAPCMSIYGASTPDEFYSSLESGDRDNGVLNRFLMLAAHMRPAERDPELDASDVPIYISDGLKSLWYHSGDLAAGRRNVEDSAKKMETPIVVPWASDAARDAYKEFGREIEARGDRDPSTRAMLARTVEMSIRLATIRALGRSPTARVDVEDLAWGQAIALWSADLMIRDVRMRMSENEHQAQAQKVLRKIGERGKISHRDLLRSLQSSIRNKDLHAIIHDLAEAELIRLEAKSAAGAPGRPKSPIYHIVRV